jgi:integral membrane sensor domain MASE1
VNVKVSVLTTAFGVVRAADQWKFPAVDADHTLIWVIVSVAVIVNAGELDRAIAPAAAAEKVADWRVVTAEIAVVPAAPGSAVCSWINVPAIPVKVVPRRTFNQALAVLTAWSPAAISYSPQLRAQHPDSL